MRPSAARKLLRGSRGFTMVTAIFLLVVLAALGAFILLVTTIQEAGSAADVLGARTYQAARAGIEWGVYKITRGGGSCAAKTSFGFPASQTLTGITVTVRCTDYADGSSSPTIHVYEIEATACNQPVSGDCPNTAAPGSTYVERRVRVKI